MTAPKRRWFRFSLLTLFVITTVAAAFAEWVFGGTGQRERMLELLHARGAYSPGMQLQRPYEAKPISWTTSTAWSHPVRFITLDRSRVSDAEILEVKRLFPEAEVAVILPQHPFF